MASRHSPAALQVNGRAQYTALDVDEDCGQGDVALDLNVWAGTISESSNHLFSKFTGSFLIAPEGCQEHERKTEK